MSSTWTDSEYGRIAKALGYPLESRTRLLVDGISLPSDMFYVPWRRLHEMSEPNKAKILVMADQIEEHTQSYRQSTLCAPDVTRVGDISKDVAFGNRERRRIIAEMAAELSGATNIAISPNAWYLNGSGGLNAQITCLCLPTSTPDLDRRRRSPSAWRTACPMSGRRLRLVLGATFIAYGS